MSTQSIMDALVFEIELRTGEPKSKCYCFRCRWFDMCGYETENRQTEWGYRSGWCLAHKRPMQECNFCSKAQVRDKG